MRIKQAASVAFLGVPGSYSYQAAITLFPDAELVGKQVFNDVVATVTDGSVDIAVVPIENSIHGRVADVHGLMMSTELQIAGEHLLAIEHCLVGPSGFETHVDLAKVTRVTSKTEALSQCRRYLDEHVPHAVRVSAPDSATAVKDVVDNNIPTELAIGSAFAATQYQATVLETEIADNPRNTTRFLAMTRPDNILPDEDADFTSLIFQTSHNPGALIDALTAFRAFDVNMTKLETYMVYHDIVNPNFYVDVAAGMQEQRMKDALALLEKETVFVKILGSYKSSSDRSASVGFLPASDRERPNVDCLE
ncbi:MAG: prephenate dehydratase domain-containing protein [Pseudomonadota bacterium]